MEERWEVVDEGEVGGCGWRRGGRLWMKERWEVVDEGEVGGCG